MQDFRTFAAAVEATPVSRCVISEFGNDYSGGVSSSAVCGFPGNACHFHCVLATGFSSSAPIPSCLSHDASDSKHIKNKTRQTKECCGGEGCAHCGLKGKKPLRREWCFD